MSMTTPEFTHPIFVSAIADGSFVLTQEGLRQHVKDLEDDLATGKDISGEAEREKLCLVLGDLKRFLEEWDATGTPTDSENGKV